MIEGQNVNQIKAYQREGNSSIFDPCIPMKFDESRDIIITFENIERFEDWYP